MPRINSYAKGTPVAFMLQIHTVFSAAESFFYKSETATHTPNKTQT